MSTGIFGIGISGITAAQLGLLATDHNITNANTPGYTRQGTVQATNNPVYTGAGAIGQGVHVQTMERMYDRFLTAQVNTAQTKVSELDAYYSSIKQIDNLLADPTAGLSPALQDYFSAVQQVAANPSLISARQLVVSSAQTLISRYQSIDGRLDELANQVDGQISDAVAEINSYASQIADLNQRIIVAESAYGQPANDLLDQRDRLVGDLNKLVRVTTNSNSDGSYNVFIGNGQQLVVGGIANAMTATASSGDLTRVAVGLATPGGAMELPESMLQGGKLGGLIAYRSDSLDKARNELGRVAASMALTFNAQHALGQDLLGNSAGHNPSDFVANVFTLPTIKAIANTHNTGSADISINFAAPEAPQEPDFAGNFYTNLTTSDYRVTFDATGYTITRMSDGFVVQPNGTVGNLESFDGLELTVSGAGNPGDTFTIKPVASTAQDIGIDARLVSDPRLLAVAAPVTTSKSATNQGAMTLSLGKVGTQASGAPYDLTSVDVPGLTLTVAATGSASGAWVAGVPQQWISGITGTWTATYSDGYTSPASTGDVPREFGPATLSRITVDGMTFEVSGKPENGDTFTIVRNQGGIQDGRNARMLAALQTQNTMSGGTATFQSSYAQMVADNGIKSREVKIQLDAQQSVLDYANSAREAMSGVNLDEEAANMIKYQQAYQAASKILQVGNTLFETILSIAR